MPVKATESSGAPKVDKPGAVCRLARPGKDGRLIYESDEAGNRMPDFSRAGYMGGVRKRNRGMYDIVPEVAPVEGEAVLRKSSPSPFFGTPLIGHLNALGIDTLVVAGESTSGCVRATVVDACAHRYNVVVAEECVFDRHQSAHAMNLFDMHQKYADVLPLAELIEWMRQWRAPS